MAELLEDVREEAGKKKRDEKRKVTNPFEGIDLESYGLRLFVPECDLSRIDGLKQSHRRDLMSRGEYPAPIRLSPRRIVWDAADIAAWQAMKIAASKEDVAA